MKLFGLVSTATLFLGLACSVPGYALQNQQDEAKPAPQEEPKAEKPAKPREVRPAEQPAPKSEERREQSAPRPEQEQPNTQHEDNDARQAAESTKHTDHASAAAGNRGGRIPEDKFRENFGRGHTVVINRPVIVDNRPRFQYAGYWFEIIDPWPTDWSYSDECYIDFVDDTYYVFDSLHPGVRIALVVIM
jgi:hypothetical protein